MAGVAQEVFKEVLRDVVAPVLREHGFRGSGQTYWLPDDTHWMQVGFQRSTASTGNELRFTVNLVVTEKAQWDEQRREHSHLEDTPPPGVDRAEWDRQRLAQSYFPKKPSVTDGGGVRIGTLIPTIGHDHWWRVTPDDTTGLHEALDAILRYGIPNLRDPTRSANDRASFLRARSGGERQA